MVLLPWGRGRPAGFEKNRGRIRKRNDLVIELFINPNRLSICPSDSDPKENPTLQEHDSKSKPSSVAGWRSRGYLPHFDGGPIPQCVTFRLIDSFPAKCLEEWREELQFLEKAKAEAKRRGQIEDLLDKGLGTTWLLQPNIAASVEQALLHFDGDRYRLHAWVVMPNHVHVLLTPETDRSLAQIMHSWKSFTAKVANWILQRSGAFWQDEYFDRFVRDEIHFHTAKSYIERNPVNARLCEAADEWAFSSASARLTGHGVN